MAQCTVEAVGKGADRKEGEENEGGGVMNVWISGEAQQEDGGHGVAQAHEPDAKEAARGGPVEEDECDGRACKRDHERADARECRNSNPDSDRAHACPKAAHTLFDKPLAAAQRLLCGASQGSRVAGSQAHRQASTREQDDNVGRERLALRARQHRINDGNGYQRLCIWYRPRCRGR